MWNIPPSWFSGFWPGWLLASLLCLKLFAADLTWQMPARVAQVGAIKEDLKRILNSAKWPEGRVQFQRVGQGKVGNNVQFVCRDNMLRLEIDASDEEWGSTFYLGLQKLGFLFPHPRIQISPSFEQAKKRCGSTEVWKPSLKYRGFHMHTQHNSEWVHGFLMGKDAIAKDMIRWMARNGQNLLQVVLLKSISKETPEKLNQLFQFANQLGVYSGISISFAFGQQRSYALFSRWEVLLSFLGLSLETSLEKRLVEFLNEFQSDFVTFELGTSEFTKTDDQATLRWLDRVAQVFKKFQRQALIKVHASTGQLTKDGENYNFLPGRADKSIGILPHTVMFYTLEDEYAPVYGRENFRDMREFTERQAGKRPVAYFPESSYFVAFDIDVPLLLTDYLKARVEDLDFLVKNKVEGQLNFSTGQELGYWLIDWHIALTANSEYRNDPLAALRLLGEDIPTWSKILEFQAKHFKKGQLIQVLSSSTMLDELGFLHSPHRRLAATDFSRKRPKLRRQLEKIDQALAELPSVEFVKNRELRQLLEVTWLRLHHAGHLRRAILEPEQSVSHLQLAKDSRERAHGIVSDVIQSHNRYPQAKVFESHENITSYGFGYGYPAAELHFWKREEEMIRQNRFHFWFMNIYDPFRLLLY